MASKGVVNINTASQEELRSIRDIGEQRAKIILNARAEKGKLTLEDLKTLQGLPSTIWDPLVAAGKIIFETPVEEDPVEKIQEEMDKIRKDLETKLFILEQEKTTAQYEHKNKIKEMEEQMQRREEESQIYVAQLAEQKAQYETELRNMQDAERRDKEQLQTILQKSQQERDDMVRQLEKMHTEMERKLAPIQEMELLAKERDDLKSAFDKFQSQVAEERTLLMEKVQKLAKQCDDEQKARNEQLADFKKQEQQLRLHNTQLEEEVKHIKLSKLISEELAPFDIYKPKSTPSAGQSGTNKETEDPNKKEADKETNKKNEVDKDTNSSMRDRPWLSNGPLPPKLATFDGKSEWRPYYVQFIHISNKYLWDDKQRLDKLVECLRDKALKFYSTRQPSVQNNFKALAEKMNQRFGNKDLPYTIRRQLQDARQNLDESVEEFAERVQEMATDGYGTTTPENVVETISVDAFLKGCTDKKAALFAMEKTPTTLDQALQFVKSSIHNQRILLGYKTKTEAVKRVQFDEDPDTDQSQSNLAVRVLNKQTNSWQQSIENRLQRTEKDIYEMKTDISRILQTVTQSRGGNSRQSSPARSPVRNFDTCFRCNEKGHFARDCNKTTPNNRSRSPSPRQYKPLNEQGRKI